MLKPVLTAAELNTYIAEVYPQIMEQFPGYEVVEVSPGFVRVDMMTDDSHIRAGGTVSGPTLFALADMGGYACVLSHVGREALAVTTNLNINFMRKAPPGRLEGHSRILKLGKRLMVYDIEIRCGGETDVIAHATGTYAIPPK
ncbi:MAG: PaaI family thioesterase [Pseudomonadota bacterium]